MRLILVDRVWWWLECLCGAPTCTDNPLQEPFVFNIETSMSRVIRQGVPQ